jgi:hypothetical protein
MLLTALVPETVQIFYPALTRVYLCIGRVVFCFIGHFIWYFPALSGFVRHYHFRVCTKNVTFDVTFSKRYKSVLCAILGAILGMA